MNAILLGALLTMTTPFFAADRPFVQVSSHVVQLGGLSDLCEAGDGRLFVVSDLGSFAEISETGEIIRHIDFVGTVPGTTIVGSDAEAICWIGGDEFVDEFAILIESGRRVFWVTVGRDAVTCDLSTVVDHTQCPGSGDINEAMRRSPLDPDLLIVSRTKVTSTTPSPREVDILRTPNGIVLTTDVQFVLSPASYYFQIRSVSAPVDLHPYTISPLRTGNGNIWLVERAADGTHISSQKIETIGTYVEGIVCRRNVADNGWVILLCVDRGTNTTTPNLYRYERLD